MMATAEKSGYAPNNGLNIYYEIHGEGEPLFLLQGGLLSTSVFDHLTPLFAKTRRVIAVDLQAHGRTADIDRPISYEAMADDMAEAMKYLSIAKADFLGYSLGAGVALQTSVRHPELVKKLVVISVAFRRDGWYADIRMQMDQMGASLGGADETVAALQAICPRRSAARRLDGAGDKDVAAIAQGLRPIRSHRRDQVADHAGVWRCRFDASIAHRGIF